MKDRIYYGWWILFSSIVIVYLAGTILFGFPAYYSFLIAGFGWGHSQLLFGNTILQWVFGLTGLLWGVPKTSASIAMKQNSEALTVPGKGPICGRQQQI